MDKPRIMIIAILVIATIFLAGCTSSPSVPAQPSSSQATVTGFDQFLLTPGDLPQGLVLAGGSPMQELDITDTMRRLGLQRGYRTLYADVIPLSDKSKVIEQDILIFSGTNASSMLEEHKNSFAARESNAVTALPLPDPDIGDRSFAIKVTSTGPTGTESYYYVIGFVKSGIYEVFSMEGTPATYATFLQLAERAAGKIR